MKLIAAFITILAIFVSLSSFICGAVCEEHKQNNNMRQAYIVGCMGIIAAILAVSFATVAGYILG